MGGSTMKKIPMRRCVACQLSKPKKELLRVVRTPEDTVLVDLSGKKSGRGAYICYNLECLKLARKKNVLERKLESKLTDETYSLIESEINNHNEKESNP
jgi:predicted RNA-binding protein YlxR (DUF448 family)